MSAVRFAPVPTLLRSLAVGCALIVGTVLPAGVAAADAPVGTTVVGTLLQAYPESRDAAAGADQPISWVQNTDGDTFRIPTDEVEGIDPGTKLQVTLDTADDDSGADPLHDVTGTTVLTPAPAAPVLRDPAGITNQVTVVRVNPDGTAPDGVTVQQLADVVDTQVAGFWSGQSNGAISVGVTRTVADWVTPTAGCADPTGMWNEVAATVGFTPGPGKHLMLYVSHAATNCSYALGEVGSSPASGGRMYVRDTLASVIAHELGHNFGLGHSSGLQCDATVESGSCRTAAYRDYYDVMGVSWARLGALTAAQADRLGVLTAAERADVAPGAATSSYTLAPLAGTGGTRAVRMTASDGTAYWLEFRAPAGQDSWLGTAQNRYSLDTGVLLHRAGGFPDTSLLLDGTPSAAGAWDRDLRAALPVGVAVPVHDGSFTVTVTAVSAGTAAVTVQAAPGAPAAAVAAPAPAGTVIAGHGVSPAAPPSAPEPAAAAGRSGAGPVVATPAIAELADQHGTRWTTRYRVLAAIGLSGLTVLAAVAVRRRVRH